MDPVQHELQLVIYRWCGASPTQYTGNSFLRDIWAAHVPVIAYEPNGITRFMQALYSDPLFSGCSAAHSITPGELLTGGDLQTVVQVYGRLIPCEPAPLSSGPNE
jgi:hypothetical protein